MFSNASRKNSQPDLSSNWIERTFEAITPVDGTPILLVLPHDAGPHTQRLMAAGLRQLIDQPIDKPIDTVIILSSDPEDNNVKCWVSGKWDTPSGAIEVEEMLAKELLRTFPVIKNSAHAALPPAVVQLLPFLKYACPSAKIIPLSLPPTNLDQAQSLGEQLSELTNNPSTVILSLGNLDDTSLTALEFSDASTFRNSTAAPLDNLPKTNLPDLAPVLAGLAFAQKFGGDTVTILRDIPGQKLHHTSVMLWKYLPPSLDSNQKDRLIQLALTSIKEYISSGRIPPFQTQDPVLLRPSGVFVTLHLHGMLRGCIGHMAADMPLYRSVQEMAVAAATSDPRFHPMQPAEVEQVHIKIAILSPLKRTTRSQIQVGRHGALISYAGRRGVLLPEVPVEHNWDRDTFLENLCYKAGLSPDILRENPALYSFSSVAFSSP